MPATVRHRPRSLNVVLGVATVGGVIAAAIVGTLSFSIGTTVRRTVE